MSENAALAGAPRPPLGSLASLWALAHLITACASLPASAILFPQIGLTDPG